MIKFTLKVPSLIIDGIDYERDFWFMVMIWSILRSACSSVPLLAVLVWQPAAPSVPFLNEVLMCEWIRPWQRLNDRMIKTLYQLSRSTITDAVYRASLKPILWVQFFSAGTLNSLLPVWQVVPLLGTCEHQFYSRAFFSIAFPTR